jgi:hypothetical protein
MSQLLRLEVLVTSLALVLAIAAYLFNPSTVDFFAVVVTAVAWTIAVVRALLLADGP